MNECVVAFLMLSLLGSGQTFLTHRTEEEVGIDLSKNYHPSKSPTPSSMLVEPDSPAYMCLEVSPNLPTCDFDKVEYPMEEDDSPSNNNERKKREVESQNSIIIYKIEGCLPSRLPFKLPMCEPDESSSSSEVRILRPFKASSDEETVPSIFPEYSHSKWLRMMKNMGYHPETPTIDYKSEDVKEERVRANQESESIMSVKRKSKTPKKYSSKFFRGNDWSQDENQEKDQLSKSLQKAQKRIEEDVKEARDLGQKLDQLVAKMEFPYSVAIPYDPEKLKVARRGSEFPYSKAISFDARKLQVARERSALPYWKGIGSRGLRSRPNFDDLAHLNEIPYGDNFLHTKKSHHSRRLQSVGKDQTISFDSGMLEAAKQGGILPHSKDIPREVEDQEREKKTRVPLRETDNQHASFRSHKPRRLAENFKEEIEFPYSEAIPFDPEKLRPTNSTKQTHHQSRKLRVFQEGSEFPYPKAVPFDPAKLVSKRKSGPVNSKFETELESSEEYPLSRKPLALSAGNNLSFALFVPHNRRASNHHLKDRKRKSC